MSGLGGLSTLYICYNGMSESLVRSQVLNYQEGLADRGVAVTLLTFEKSPPEDEAAIRAELAGKGIDWHWRPYSGKQGARGTGRDIAAGMRFIMERRKTIDFVHCRSFIPALMGYGAQLRGGPRFIYDVRGFFAHEKRYKGRIESDLQFRVTRFLEARVYKRASAIVTLTDAAMRLLERDYLGEDSATPRRVIPTCANVSPFLQSRRPLDTERPRIVYSGSLGAGYLCDEVFEFFARTRKVIPGAKLEILTRSDPDLVRAGAGKAGLRETDYRMRSLKPAQMAEALLQCDAALSFIKPDFAKIASCPTKMAEYLAAGLPVIANTGIGDVDAQLGETRTGVVMQDFGDAEYDRAIAGMQALLADPEMIARGRKAAKELFSLDLGIERYAEIYEALGRAKR